MTYELEGELLDALLEQADEEAGPTAADILTDYNKADEDTPIKVSELEAGQVFTLWGKSWQVLGRRLNSVYFKNTRARKYTSFCRVDIQGNIYIGKLQKSQVKISHFDKHGFELASKKDGS